MASVDPSTPTRALSNSGVDPTLDESQPDLARRLQRGAVVDRYVVLDRIGVGGMGVVYAAFDPELDRKVALKLLRPDPAHSAKLTRARQRLLREAQAMAKLSHPNVLPVYDVGTTGDDVFIAVEYIDGETADQWIKRGPHPWRDVLGIMVQAGRGLAAAHAEGMIHRDFKPHNVLIGDGRARVMDFGLARPSGDTESSAAFHDTGASGSNSALELGTLTKTGFVMGTPAYMAPEQQRNRPLDARTDQFSYCVSLYQALYGERPFKGGESGEILRAIVAGEVRPAPKGISVPGWLRKVVLKGLAAEPDARHASMAALLESLRFERRQSSRLFTGLALATFVIIGGGLAYSQYLGSDDGNCGSAGDAIGRVWNDSRRAEISTAFQSTSLSYASDTWARAASLLDTYAKHWTDSRTDACEATHVRLEQSAALLDLRIACLDHRLSELDELLTIFTEASPEIVERAVQASARLTPLDRCADAAALNSDGAPPPPRSWKSASRWPRTRSPAPRPLNMRRCERRRCSSWPVPFSALASSRTLRKRPSTRTRSLRKTAWTSSPRGR